MASAHPGGERVEQLASTHDPTNSWRRTDVGLTLAYRLLRWPNNKTTLVQRLRFLVIPSQNKTTLIPQTADSLSFSKLQIRCHSPNCRFTVILQTADPLSFSSLRLYHSTPANANSALSFFSVADLEGGGGFLTAFFVS